MQQILRLLKINIKYIRCMIVVGMIYKFRKVEFSLSLYTIYYTC